MTSSTGSSVASASASKLQEPSPPQSGGLFYGMDEAGYGPNLGPLLIAVTKWRTPSDPQQCDFYRLLADVVSCENSCRGQKLHLADSKLVNTGKTGFRSLETSALALVSCLGWEIDSLRTLWNQLVSESVSQENDSSALPPWYDGEIRLPVVADLREVQQRAEKLRDCLQLSGVELIGISGDVVSEPRFNRLVGAIGSNKGLTLSRLAFRLLRSVWSPEETTSSLIVGDKHGGRNRYDELLSEVLSDEMIFRLEEGQQLSRYRIGTTELRFQVGGEAHLPVACASIIAKYIRELAMDLLNSYWEQHCPGVKPTRGYPNDARRFREDVQAVRTQLEISDELFWRSR